MTTTCISCNKLIPSSEVSCKNCFQSACGAVGVPAPVEHTVAVQVRRIGGGVSTYVVARTFDQVGFDPRSQIWIPRNDGEIVSPRTVYGISSSGTPTAYTKDGKRVELTFAVKDRAKAANQCNDLRCERDTALVELERVKGRVLKLAAIQNYQSWAGLRNRMESIRTVCQPNAEVGKEVKEKPTRVCRCPKCNQDRPPTPGMICLRCGAEMQWLWIMRTEPNWKAMSEAPGKQIDFSRDEFVKLVEGQRDAARAEATKARSDYELVIEGSAEWEQSYTLVKDELERVKGEGQKIEGHRNILYSATEDLLDGLDSNADPERCGLSNEQWETCIKKARFALCQPSGKVGEVDFKKDGDKWCATVRGEFINLQESPAGFGHTKDEAREELQLELSQRSIAGQVNGRKLSELELAHIIDDSCRWKAAGERLATELADLTALWERASRARVRICYCKDAKYFWLYSYGDGVKRWNESIEAWSVKGTTYSSFPLALAALPAALDTLEGDE